MVDWEGNMQPRENSKNNIIEYHVLASARIVSYDDAVDRAISPYFNTDFSLNMIPRYASISEKYSYDFAA